MAGVPVKDIISGLISKAGKQDSLTVQEVFDTKVLPCGTAVSLSCGTYVSALTPDPFPSQTHICTQCVLGSQATEKMGAPGIECVIDIARQYHGKVPLAVASSGNKVPCTLQSYAPFPSSKHLVCEFLSSVRSDTHPLTPNDCPHPPIRTTCTSH